MVAVTAGSVTFEVDAIAYDKDGTLVDLDAAWGPAARAWVETAAQGDAGLMSELATRMGLDLDAAANDAVNAAAPGLISAAHSRVRVRVLHTHEESVIARHTERLTDGSHRVGRGDRAG